MTPRVLILGGTAEARALAAELTSTAIPTISSLAGRVSAPRLPAGEVRVGGFGGADGLARWLEANEIAAVLDATHPFAERISASAVLASARCRVPLLRVERPGWSTAPGDRWTWVADLPAAADAVRRLGARRVFLTTGRHGLRCFSGDPDTWFLVRCVDPPDPAALPPRSRVVLGRGPYTLDGELAMVDAEAIDLVVTKDSGGPMTQAKLAAARIRGLPVVIVSRPPRPDVPSVATVAEGSAWARARLG